MTDNDELDDEVKDEHPDIEPEIAEGEAEVDPDFAIGSPVSSFDDEAGGEIEDLHETFNAPARSDDSHDTFGMGVPLGFGGDDEEDLEDDEMEGFNEDADEGQSY